MLPLLENVSVALPEACRGMRIVTSPLKRCVQTAALLGAPDAPREPRLAEMDWGRWQGESLGALRARLGDEMRENEARGLDFTPLGGESPRLLLSRLRGWLEEVARSRKPTLAITHRGVIRVHPRRGERLEHERQAAGEARLESGALFRARRAGHPRASSG